MKFYNITNINGFFDAVSKCKGEVALVSNEGDRLNLKSRLSQILISANVFSGGKIPEMEIMTSDPDDMKLLLNYVMLNE